MDTSTAPGLCAVGMDDGTACGRPLSTPDFCPMHYKRNKDGRAMGAPARRYVAQGKTCEATFDSGVRCDEPTHAEGLCVIHWSRKRDGRPLGKPFHASAKPRVDCTYCDDGTPAYSGGMCSAHYQRRRDGRDMYAPVRHRRSSDAEKGARILARATWRGDGCLIAANIGSDGYATSVKDSEGKPIKTHRLVYRVKNGEIPTGEQIHHKCGVHACVNPEHLEAATQRENVGEMLARRSYEAQIAALVAELDQANAEIDRLRAVEVRQLGAAVYVI